MAKLTDEKNVVKDENTTVNEWGTPNSEKIEVDRWTLDNLLQRMDRLELENEELRKGQMNVFTEWRKFYEWPRKYCYKLRWGVPVLWFKPYKKDPTKDLVYQNQYGAWISNHYLKLDLANGKSVDVEVNEFNRDYTLSDKMLAEKTTDNRGNLLGYTFNTEDWGEIIVAPNIINE